MEKAVTFTQEQIDVLMKTFEKVHQQYNNDMSSATLAMTGLVEFILQHNLSLDFMKFLVEHPKYISVEMGEVFREKFGSL